MKILLKNVKEAEKEYAKAVLRWGEKNQITLNSMVKYYGLKKRYEEQKIDKRRI